MQSLLRFLETVEIGGLFILALAVLVVGNKLCQDQRKIRAFSLSIAGLLFIAYIAYHFIRGSLYSDNLADVTIRGLLGAGLALGTLWIVLPVLSLLIGGPLAQAHQTLRSWKAAWNRSATERERDRQEKAWEREHARKAPERERARREAEDQARKAADAQTRRDDARARCLAFYVTHAPEIGKRFTRDMFDEFLREHMTNDRPPEVVEQRERQLVDVMQIHLEKAGGKKQTLAELAHWFLEQKQQIDAAALNEDDKELLLTQLEERYIKLQEKHLRSVQP